MRQLAIAAAVLGVGFSSFAYSQGRTIEETLVVSDPTVAAQGKWKVGGAVEYWYVHTEYDVVNSSGTKVGESTLNLTQPGFNLFAAHGNWTLQGTSRKGDGDYTANQGTLNYGGPQRQKDDEITLRYLFPTRAISPYVLVGYGKTHLETEYNQSAGGPGWTCTGAGNLNMTRTTEYKGPLFGGGAIVPFSEKLGMRADLRLHWYKGNSSQSGSIKTGSCADSSGSGLGYDFVVTGYWNIVGGLNAQLGAKTTWLNAGSDVPQWFKIGVFGMLGYTVQF